MAPQNAVHMMPYVSEVESLYKTSAAICEDYPDVPAYAFSAGENALMLANYYVEVDLRPVELSKYALEAYGYFEKYQRSDEFNKGLDKEEKDVLGSFCWRSLAYVAYVAYSEKRYEDTRTLLNKSEVNLYVLALGACAQLRMGRETKDIEKIRTGIALFESLDDNLDAPAKTKFQNMVFFTAYHDCISMMEQNAEEFPGCNLCWEKSRIVSCLQKAIGLLDNKPFILSLQNMLDQYTKTKETTGTTENLFFWEAQCGTAKQTFYPRFDLGADDSWVLTYGVKELPTGQQVSSAENSRLELSKMRNGPQYKCPWCGNKELAWCGSCGKMTCYNGVDRHSVCSYCGERGRIKGGLSRKEMKGSIIASGSGQ
ncbi:MAG: hypothetical protein Q4C48_11100 [Lachnospiraceae bacterium]|nr:hypothetical protein [Lachnospiraceae bacterium]